MKKNIIFLFAFLIQITIFAQTKIEDNAIKLSIVEVNAIANALEQQKFWNQFLV